MANGKGIAPSVELADALKAGFHDAMKRIEDLNIDPCNTLVDQISAEEWQNWDACGEIAIVMDKDGLNGEPIDDGELIAA